MAQFCDGHIEAIADLEKTLELMQTYNNHVGAAEVNHMLGACLLQLGDLGQAESHINTALNFYRQMEMRPYLIRTLFILAELLTQQNRPTEAHNTRTEANTLMAALNHKQA